MLTRAGIPSDISITYARGLLAIKEDFEKLPQINGIALMQALVELAQKYPQQPLLVLEIFQERLKGYGRK